MKKLLCLTLILSFSFMAFAFRGNSKNSSTFTTSVKKSEKVRTRQLKIFHSIRRYSALVNGPRPKFKKPADKQPVKDKDIL